MLLVACTAPAPSRESAAEAAPIRVETTSVRSVDLPAMFEVGGVVRGRSTARVASRIMAPVLEVHVRAGDRVKRGASLVTLDGREMSANRSRATATLTGSVESVRAAEGAVRSAEASLTLARATRDRVRMLHDRRSATDQELDQASSAVDAADGQLSSARANLAAATAGRDAAQAANDAATVAASYTVLSAPFDGVVTERSVDPGAMANPGMPLLTLEDTAALRLEVAMDEARARLVATGQDVEVQVDGADQAGPWVKARVSEVARIDPASHSFLVKLDLPAGFAVRSGAFGRARVAGPARRTLVVPASAAVRRGQLTFVFVTATDGRVRLQPISPGAVSGDTLEVLTGVRDGDRVVVNPPPTLFDGVRINGTRP
jgi:RND family efflux transporter MFP subunit